MSEGDRQNLERLQVVMTALLKQQLGESLGKVDAALARWRGGDLGVFEAHAELLKHAARAEQLAERMARLGVESAAALIRDAFDGGLIDRDEFVELVGRKPEEVDPSPPLDVEVDRPTPPDKRELIEKLLTDGPALVHVDARRPGVSVPSQFKGDPKLVLRFGYGLTPPIVDLCVDDSGIAGTLTFSGVPHRCVLPWATVYAVVSEVDQRGMVWPDDVPAAVVDSLAKQNDLTESTSQDVGDAFDEVVRVPAQEKRRGSHLKLVK